MLRFDRHGAGWPNRAHSRFVAAGGIDWHVQELGEGAPILLLHGTGSATHSWRDLAPLLAAGGRVIAPDLPGHGFTSRPARFSLPAMAAAVGTLLARLDVAPAVIVGHSAGAAIGARLTLDGLAAPRLVAGIGAALKPFPGAGAALFPMMAKMLVANPLVPALFATGARLGRDTGGFLRRATGSRIAQWQEEFYGRLFADPGHVGAALGMMAAWDLAPLVGDLPRLGAPLLLLHGEHDRAVPAGVSVALAARLPGTRATILPGLGHLAHEEAPDRIGAAILEAMDDGAGTSAAA